MLIQHLPPESATKTAIRDAMSPDELAALPEPVSHGPWSRLEMLTARVGDLIAQLAWMQSTGETTPPEPYPRPGVDLSKKKSTATLAYAKAYLDEVLRNNGAAPAPDWTPPEGDVDA